MGEIENNETGASYPIPPQRQRLLDEIADHAVAHPLYLAAVLETAARILKARYSPRPVRPSRAGEIRAEIREER